MVFLLGAVACTSLVNIVLAFASRRGWDGRAVLGWSYFASAALAGLMAALQAPALSFPAPGQLAGALTGAMTPASSMSFAVWFGLLSGGLYLLCLVTVEKSVREKGAGGDHPLPVAGHPGAHPLLGPFVGRGALGRAAGGSGRLGGGDGRLVGRRRARGGKGAAGGVPFGGRGGIHRQGVPEMSPGGIPARLSLRAVCRLRGAGPAPPCARAQAAPPPGWRWARRWGRAAPFPPF